MERSFLNLGTKAGRVFGAILLLWAAGAGAARGKTVACLDHGKTIGVDNQDVILWKTTTANQYLARAHVQGTLSKVYPDKNGHNHFEISIGANKSDRVEIVYNKSFGKLPSLRTGSRVEVCGDYITSNQATSQYPASPDGAIIHWVHRSDSPAKHDSGYVIIDGSVYGGVR